MFKLLRMDLHRLKKSKSVYICLGILLMSVAFIFVLLFLTATPRGQEIAIGIGMLDRTDVQEFGGLLSGMTVLDVCRQACIDAGGYTVVIAVLFTIFVCDDFKNGFIKNILSVHVNRWEYMGSKMLAFAIVDFIYLMGVYGFSLLFKVLLMGDSISCDNPGPVFFYLLQAWVLTMAILALVMAVCMLTRSVAAGILTSMLVGGGVIVSVLNAFLRLFDANKWLEHSIYLSLANASSVYQQPSDLAGLATGIIFLILYAVIGGMILTKKDI